MQSAARAYPMPGQGGGDITKRMLAPIPFLLQTGDQAATVDRLFDSQHVKDLRLIIVFALIAVYLVLVVGLSLSIENEASKTAWTWRHSPFVIVGNFLTFFAPVLAVFGAVLAWAYQVGSTRLGVVDLFACEVSTLCRVAAVVDTVHGCVEKFDHGPPVEPAGTGMPQLPEHQFSSQENYFPVFENNTKDLQTLEARVVINITEFYTYMKAVRDSMRALAEIKPQPADLEPTSNKAPAAGAWHEAARNVVYMLFLGLESARHAITDLVEFEPEKAERTIVILINELAAYRFLCSQFPDQHDIHHQRIVLRDAEYRHMVPKLCSYVEARRALEKTDERGAKLRLSQWEPALRLLPELRKRFHDATESISR